MSIVGTLPVTLTNGTTADASQVMQDLNWIISQTNANAAALAGGNAFTGPQTIAGDTIATLLATQALQNKSLTGNTTINPAVSGFYAGSPSGLGYFAIVDSYSAVDTKMWDFYTDGSNFTTRILNDANNLCTVWLAVNRTGMVVNSVDFPAGAFSAAGGRLKISTDGRVYGTALHNNANPVTGTINQYIASGTFTPTYTASTNASTGTAFQNQWMRVGNVVTVSGTVTVTPLAAGSPFLWTLSLPIPSTLGSYGLSGAATTSNSNVSGASVYAQGGSMAGFTAMPATNALPVTFTFTYTYTVA